MPAGDRFPGRVAVCLVAAWLALASPSGAAALFRWTDAAGVVHFADQPPLPGSQPGVVVEPLVPRSGRLSVVETVVVRDNAMRDVVNAEVRRQQRQRADAVKAAEAEAARAERVRERHCEGLRRRIAAAERAIGSLANGRLRKLDDQYGQDCR